MATTYYIWDVANDSYLLETDGTGATTAVYTNEPIQFGKLISQRRGNATSYYHFDGQQSTRQLTDQNQDVTDQYIYTAHGEIIAHSGSTTNPFLFLGLIEYYTNTQLGDVYSRERVFSSSSARSLTSEPWSGIYPAIFAVVFATAQNGRSSAVRAIDQGTKTGAIPTAPSAQKADQLCKQIESGKLPGAQFLNCLLFKDILDELARLAKESGLPVESCGADTSKKTCTPTFGKFDITYYNRPPPGSPTWVDLQNCIANLKKKWPKVPEADIEYICLTKYNAGVITTPTAAWKITVCGECKLHCAGKTPCGFVTVEESFTKCLDHYYAADMSGPIKDIKWHDDIIYTDPENGGKK